jgi:hypothetical protein
MNTIIKGIALSLSLLAIAGATAIPASAQTPHRQHHVVVRPAPAPLPYGAHYGGDGLLYSPMGSAIPGYVLSQPNECFMEDGYSHWTTCTAD